MNPIKSTLRLLLLVFLIIPADAQEIAINETNGRQYFHLAHTLRKGDFSLTHPDEFFDPKYPDIKGACELGANGYFTIYIRKQLFPIPAPNCKSDWLKLTMKGSNDLSKIKSKYELWNQIQEVESGEWDQLQVIIELNPYVTIISADPLKLELDYCNLWFRCAYDQYIPHTDPIRIKN